MPKAPRTTDRRQPALPSVRPTLQRPARSARPRPRHPSSPRWQPQRDQPPTRPPKLQRQERRRDPMVTPIRGEEWVAPERADTPTSDGEKYLRSQLLVVSSRTRLLCSGCGEAKPLEAFNSSRRVVDGFAWWCRDCQREAQRVWRLGHRDAVEAYNVGRSVGMRWVKCSECDEVLVRRSNQVVCSRRCKDRRYRRLHPEAYRERQARKYARRRARASGGAA